MDTAPDAPVAVQPLKKRGRGRPVGSLTVGDPQWATRVRKLRRKVLLGETLSTEEVESFLVWRAIGLTQNSDEAKVQAGFDLMASIYETRSKARLAPGNAPAKQKPTGAAAKYGVEAPERASPKASDAVDESPRGWIPDQA